MKKRKFFIILSACAFLVSSCSTQTHLLKESTQKRNIKVSASSKAEKGNFQMLLSPQTPKAENNKIQYVPVIVPPYGSSLVYQKSAPKVEKIGGKYKVNVENILLYNFINLVFGKTLNASYYVDPYIKRIMYYVTLKMEKPLGYNNFLDTVTTILSHYNIAVNKKGNMFFIMRGRTAPKTQKTYISRFIIGRYIPQSLPDSETVAAIIPFYYVNAKRYEGFIRGLTLSKKAKISILSGNYMMITDKVSNIREALKIIRLFDREYFEKKNIAIVPLNYIDPKDFVNKLKKLLPYEGLPVASKLGQPGIILIPIPEMQGVIVVSPKKEWINIVQFWKSKLDTIKALGSQPRFFVYYPKNRRAKDLYNVLNQAGRTLLSTNTKIKSKQKASLESNFKVILDEGRNALIIFAPPSIYEQLKTVLDKLDTLPKEVLVQVTIAEVTLTNNLQYGIEWYLKHSGKYNGVLQTIGGLGLGAGGLNYSLITDTKKFQALLNSYASKNLINILSSPRLVVLDNHDASINVGTQVPVVTSETNTNNIQEQGTTSLLRTIQYRNTGVILNIKPTINSNGILTLTIHQEVSQPQVNNTSKIDSPLILNRDINTTVVLKSGTTLLLGGLIQKNKSKTVNEVPILGDIPILGNLFKTTSKGTTKTELIIEITPYIISNVHEANIQRKNFESLIKWFHEENGE